MTLRRPSRTALKGGGGFTFHAPIADGYEGVAFTVAALRLGDHAHLDVDSGRATRTSDTGPRSVRGHAGRLILRWPEWESLRAILDAAPNVHVAEVERPTRAQLAHHLRMPD